VPGGLKVANCQWARLQGPSVLCYLQHQKTRSVHQWGLLESRELRDASKRRAGSMKGINLALLETDQPQSIFPAGTNEKFSRITERDKREPNLSHSKVQSDPRKR